MKAVKPWVKPLKVKFQDYEAWSTQVGAEESITYWALDRGKLRAQDYLYWAREYFQIPVLKDTFFREHANGELYFQMKSVANWSAEMVPIAQWDGIVYIGCVEPPEDVNWSFPVRYVLVSARTLKKFWSHLQHEDAASQPEPSAKTHTPEDLDFGLSQETPEAAAGEGSLAPDSPEGIQLQVDSDPALDAEAPEGISLEAPEGFRLDLPEDPAASAVLDSYEDAPQGFSPEMAAHTGEQPKAESHSNSDELAPQSDFPQQETGEDVTGSLPMFQDHDAGTLTRTNFGMTLTGANKLANPEAVVDLDNDTPTNLGEATSDKQVAAWAFNELKQIFNVSMILLADGTQLTPWKWESLWSPESERAFAQFEGNKPGIFRIVARTKQPYHGYVVDSPANQEFFHAWGYIELPKHVTVLPLKYEDHMLGMVLCVGEEAANTGTNLATAERIIDTMSSHLKKYMVDAA